MRRPSYEILADLMKRLTARDFAYRVRVHVSLAYKWCTKPEQAEEAFGSGDARSNPIDRVEDILRTAVTNGHHDIAVEIMELFAREFGGAYVSGDTVRVIEKVAELARASLSASDLAQLKTVSESKEPEGNVVRCMFCGFKYVRHDLWRPLSHACDQCYVKAQEALSNYDVRPRKAPGDGG